MNQKPARLSEAELGAIFSDWKQAPLPVARLTSDASAALGRQAQLDGAISAHIKSEAERRKRHRRALVGVSALVALAAAFWIGIGLASAPESYLRASVGAHELWRGNVRVEASKVDAATELPHGTTLKTMAQSTASIVHESGTQLDLAPESTLRLDDAESVSVVRGEASFQVPKLGKRSFVVRTSVAEVTVHGTQFVVEVREDGATRVAVFEGLVAVHSRQGERRLVYPGQSWTSSSMSAAASSSGSPSKQQPAPSSDALPSNSTPARETTSNPAPARGKSPASNGLDQSPGAAGPASSLAQQTELFRRAMQAKSAGQLNLSLQLFDELQRRFPDAPLATEARVESFRLRAQMKGQAR